MLLALSLQFEYQFLQSDLLFVVNKYKEEGFVYLSATEATRNANPEFAMIQSDVTVSFSSPFLCLNPFSVVLEPNDCLAALNGKISM